VDPISDQGSQLSVHTKYHRYALDMTKTKPGTEGQPAAFTVNPYKHIYDYRFAANGTFGWSHVSQVVTIKGHKLVVMGGMDNGSVHIYRQSPATEGETLIECAVFYASSVARDLNAEGRFDGPGEVTMATLPGGGDVCKSWYSDSLDGVWESYDGGGRTGLRHYRFGGFDAHETPIWPAAAGQFDDIDGPVPFSEVRRVLYDAERDVLTLSGYSSNGDPLRNLVPGIGYGNTDNKSAGSVVARYDNWSKGNRIPRWSRVVRVPSSTNPASEILGLAAAGDYVFTGHSGFGHEVGGPVLVYKSSDGTPVGEMNSQINGVEASSGLDIPYPLSVYQRKTGEYLVFEESDGRGRAVMYRWRP